VAKVHPVTLKLQTEGFAGIKNIGQDFKKFSSTVAASKPKLDRFIKGITAVHGNTKLSKVAFEGQISALTKLKNNVGIGTVAYQRLGVELDKVRAKMNAATAAAAPQGGMFQRLNARFNKIPVGGRAALGALAGTATAGLGTTGQLAFAGGAVGGPVGAAIGAGLGATIDTAKFASESATYAASIQKLRIALAGVTDTQEEFEYGLNVITRVSKELNVPIAESTKQFTTLSASVLGAGGTIEDAELVFEGVSSAIKATGGSADDVQSAIRAMSQIFGKGKVSAEELQGQLGERLAGAVVKFAEANGSSLQKLQKDLRDGTVGLDQVIKFAEKLNVDFGETAKEVANSSADAGARLKVQMDDLKLAVGNTVVPIGAAFQKSFADIGKGILENQDLMNGIAMTFKLIGGAAFTTFAAIKFLIRALVDLFKIQQAILKLDFAEIGRIMSKNFEDTAQNAKDDLASIAEIFKGLEAPSIDPTKPKKDKKGLPTLTGDGDVKSTEAAQNKIVELERTIQLKTTEDEIERKLLERKYKFIDAIKEAKNTTTGVVDDERILLETKLFQIDKQEILNSSLETGKEKAFSFKEELKQIVLAATDLSTQVGKIGLNAVNKLADGFAELAVSGKASFGELARSILQDLQKMIVKALFFKAITNFIPGLGNFLNLEKGGVVDGGEVSTNAKGNVFAQNKIVGYRKGDVFDSPTMFKYGGSNLGILGEAGPEGVLPLKRGRDGKLGVMSQGGGSTNIVVNVDATGSSVEGDEQQGRQLGTVISAAIQSELINQKRPGGLLA